MKARDSYPALCLAIEKCSKLEVRNLQNFINVIERPGLYDDGLGISTVKIWQPSQIRCPQKLCEFLLNFH